MMEGNDAWAWYAALTFGALVVGNFSWLRFDEPSYEDKSQFFRLYAPRFLAPKSQYRKARLGYVAVIIAIFVFFSLFPKFLLVFVPTQSATSLEKQLQGSVIPLVVATLLMSLQNVAGLKQLEHRIRSVLHAVGKIPEGLRRTVSQLKSAQFNFSKYERILQPELARLAGDAHANKLTLDLVEHEPVLRIWCKVYCLLYRISGRDQSATPIRDSFFDTYGEELESITTRREALAHRIGIYAGEFLASLPVDADESDESAPSATMDFSIDEELLDELIKLRKRLYTFIACGLRSSLESEGRVYSALVDLGFDVRREPEKPRGVQELAGLFLIVVALTTVFTVFVSKEFNQQYVQGQEWKEVLVGAILVPQSLFLLLLWALFTAMFYLAAVVGALTLRATAVAKLNWFDLDQEMRQRPISRYVGPIIFGGICGYLAMCLVTVCMFFLAAEEPSAGDLLGNVDMAMRDAVFWIPLAFIISFFALWISDARFENSNWHKMLLRALLAAVSMAVVGWVISDIISERNAARVWQSADDLPALFETARNRANLMIAFFIALLTTLLMLLVQRQEHQVQAKENLTGKSLTLHSNDGGACDIHLQPDGEVVRDSDVEDEHTTACGTWIYYPEGYVINWTDALWVGERLLNGHSVLLHAVDSLILEEYTPGNERDAEYVVQVTLKANGAPPNGQDTPKLQRAA